MSNDFVLLAVKMCYVHNQWYDISCATCNLQSLLRVIRSVKSTRDVGHKNGMRVTLYFGVVGGGLGVDSGVTAIILLEGS